MRTKLLDLRFPFLNDMTPRSWVIGSRCYENVVVSKRQEPSNAASCRRSTETSASPQPKHKNLLQHFMCQQMKALLHEQHQRRNSAFSPHSAFMCFVGFSQYTAIISLYSINRLVFVMQVQCEFCEVETGFLEVLPRTSDLV